MASSLFHRITRRVARSKPLGRPISAAAHGAGLVGFSRRLSRHSGYVPHKVGFELINRDRQPRKGWMNGANGADHVAKMVWTEGLAAYERPLPEVYSAAVRQADGAIFEVGANSGLYVVLACLLTGEPNRVHAFEPFPPAMQSMQANLALNGLSGKPHVVAKAAGAEAGEAKLYIPAKKHGDVLETSASLRSDFKGQHSGEITVPVTTLDDYVRENDIRKLSVLKADVEGFEGAVMRGAMQTLKTLRPLVFLEVLAWKTEAPALEIVRAEADYRAVWLTERGLVERSAVEVCPTSDNQLLYPRERRDQLVAIAKETGLAILSE